MSDHTGIEWAEATWNPVVGCTPVSPGCLNCYAATMSKRLASMGRERYVGLTVDRSIREGGPVRAVFNGTVRTVENTLTIPLHWRKPRRIFVNSMSDLFHEDVPFEFIDRVWAVMALCPQHTFLVLTKRPERMAEYLNMREISKAWTPGVRGGGGGDDLVKWKSPCDLVYSIARRLKGRDAAPELIWPLPNVWLGASVEDQACADERIPHLLRCPAAVRFLSCEPLLEKIDLERALYTHSRLERPYVAGRAVDWVIVGGESGPRARPARQWRLQCVVDACADAGVPCFMKQWGSRPEDMNGTPVRLRDSKGGDPAEWPADLRVRELPLPSSRPLGHS